MLLHYAALSTTKQPASSQSPVEEKGVAGCPRFLQDFMDDLLHPSDRSWTKDLAGDVFEVLSEPGRHVFWSLQTFQVTDKHVISSFPLDMDCFKVRQLFEHEGNGLKIHSWTFGRYQAFFFLFFFFVNMLRLKHVFCFVFSSPFFLCHTYLQVVWNSENK